MKSLPQEPEMIPLEVIDENGHATIAEYVEPATFEEKYEQKILPFIKSRGYASCFEMMKEFHISYTIAVRIMDILEEQGIVDAAEAVPRDGNGVSIGHGRPLLNGKRKKCLPPIVATTAIVNSTSIKELESTAVMTVLPGVVSVAVKKSSLPTPAITSVRRRVKRR